MSALQVTVHQVRFDLLAFLRNPRARVFTLATPVILLLLLVGIFHNQTVTVSGEVLKIAEYYVPHLIVVGVLGAAFGNLLTTIVAKRESGSLKRRRATPVPASAIIGGDVVTSILTALVIAAVLILIGVLFFGVRVDAAGLGVVALLCVVAAASYAALAYAASYFIGTVEAAAPAVQLTTLPLYFLSGVFIPSPNLPAWLNDVMFYLPVRPLGVALQAAFVPATNGGSRFDGAALLVILVWGAAGLLFAMRRFSWSPHRR
jgi:ABC-2 type transport system permease protein